VINELAGMWKEAAMTSFEQLSFFFLEGLKKEEKISRWVADVRAGCYPGISKYEVEMLTAVFIHLSNLLSSVTPA
jgi:hypothetical protein